MNLVNVNCSILIQISHSWKLKCSGSYNVNPNDQKVLSDHLVEIKPTVPVCRIQQGAGCDRANHLI